jgi:hypothetical protein
MEYENQRSAVSPWKSVVHLYKTKKLNSVACNPQANYTDRAAAACWRS